MHEKHITKYIATTCNSILGKGFRTELGKFLMKNTKFLNDIKLEHSYEADQEFYERGLSKGDFNIRVGSSTYCKT